MKKLSIEEKAKANNGVTSILANNYNFNKWLAWLEKQGEHAKFRDFIQVGDKVTRNKDGVLVNLSQLKRVAKKDEKQAEQKPNPCDGCINRKGCINCENGELRETEHKPTDKAEPDILIEESYQQQADDLIDMVTEKPAWSEEDKNMAHYIGNAITTDEASNYLKEKDIEVIDAHVWLESLKRRVQLQPKQEWSEDDERYLNNTISYLKDATEFKETAKLCIDWLKSLRPQTTWKPSNEQMLAIDTAINVIGKGTLSGKQLIELQEQLKKLREE